MSTEAWTVLKVLGWTASRFAEISSSARLDAEVLLAHALGTTRVGLYTGFDKPLEPDELARFRELVKRRLAGEPVAYLVGEQEFWSLPLWVDRRVLIPRRDTETLVEVAVEAARGTAGGEGRPLRVADVCTGSGAVALALARELGPEARVIATDVSADALEVARRNLLRHAAAAGDRVTLRRCDLVDGLEADAPFDVIAANPPYVPSGELAGLSREVKAEPRLALDGGADGLDVIRRLVPAARGLLAPGAGVLCVEHGHDQGDPVRRLFEAAGYAEVRTRRDLAGKDRVTRGRA